MDKKPETIKETAKEEGAKPSRPSQSVNRPTSRSREASKSEQQADKTKRGKVCDTCNPNPNRKTGKICDGCKSKPSTSKKASKTGHKVGEDKSQASTSQRKGVKTVLKPTSVVSSTSLQGRGSYNLPKPKGLKKNAMGSTDASTGRSSKTLTAETADNTPKTSDSEDYSDIPALEPIDAPTEALTSSERLPKEQKKGRDDSYSASGIKKKQTDTLQQLGLPKRVQFGVSSIEQASSKFPKTEASSSNKQTVRDSDGDPKKLILHVSVKAVDRSKKDKADNNNVPLPKESEPTSTLSAEDRVSDHTADVPSGPYKILRTILASPPLFDPSSLPTNFVFQKQTIQETSPPVNLQNSPLMEDVATSMTSLKTSKEDKIRNLVSEFFRKQASKRSDYQTSSRINAPLARLDLDNLWSRREVPSEYRTDESSFSSSLSSQDHTMEDVASPPSYSELTRRQGTEFSTDKKTTEVPSQINAPGTSTVSHHEEQNPPDSPIVPEICTTTSSMTSDQDDDAKSSSKTSTSGSSSMPEHMLHAMWNLLPFSGLTKLPSEFDTDDTNTHSSTAQDTSESSNAQMKVEVTDASEIPPETENAVDDSSKKSNEQTEEMEVTEIEREPIVPIISTSSQGDDKKSSLKKSSSRSAGIPRGMHETLWSLFQNKQSSETDQPNSETASPQAHGEQSIEEVANSSKATLDDPTEQSSASERKTEESDDSVKTKCSQSERPVKSESPTPSATNPDRKEKIQGSESQRSSQSSFQPRRKLNVSNILKHESARKQPGYEIPRRAITRITDSLKKVRKWYSAPNLPSHAAIETVASPKSKPTDAERSLSIPNLYSSIKAYKRLYARQSPRGIQDTNCRSTSSEIRNEPARVEEGNFGSSPKVKTPPRLIEDANRPARPSESGNEPNRVDEGDSGSSPKLKKSPQVVEDASRPSTSSEIINEPARIDEGDSGSLPKLKKSPQVAKDSNRPSSSSKSRDKPTCVEEGDSESSPKVKKSPQVIKEANHPSTSSEGGNEPTCVKEDNSGSLPEVKKTVDLTSVVFKKPKTPDSSQIKPSGSPNSKQEEAKKGEYSASEDESARTPDTITPSGTDLEDELETMEPGVARRISRRRRDRTPDTLVPEDHVTEDDFFDIESGTERDSIATSESPSDNTTPTNKSLKRSSPSDEKEDKDKPSASTSLSSGSSSSPKKKSKKSVRRNITPELSSSELKSTQSIRSPRKLDKRPLPFDFSTVDSEDEPNDDKDEESKRPDIPSPNKQSKGPDNSSPRKTP